MRDTHPTKVHLTEAAATLIDELGSQGFTVEQLLEKSNISKGSLYHHFEDFHDVIMQDQVLRFARYVEEDIAAQQVFCLPHLLVKICSAVLI